MRIYGSLFSGIGGLDLAVELVTRARVVFHCEPDPYCAAVLAMHWPRVHNFGSIEAVKWRSPIWSVQDSRARVRRRRGSAPGSKTTDPRFGSSSSAFFATFDPVSSSWKTPQVSLLPGEGLTKYSGTWPRSGTMRNGRLWRREPLEHPTDAIASSSSPHTYPYPTPSATSYGTSGNGTGNNTVSRGRPSLDTIAKRGRWPTPVTTDAKDAARTTTQTGIMHPGETLTDRMRGRLAPMKPKNGSDTMVLVPEFVEALLGLPEGWTRVCDDVGSSILETAALPSKAPSPSPSSP